MPNVFIGTHVKLRSELGGMWSPEFEREKLVCEEHWKEVGLPDAFSAPPQYRYEDYITSNAHKKIRIKP